MITTECVRLIDMGLLMTEREMGILFLVVQDGSKIRWIFLIIALLFSISSCSQKATFVKTEQFDFGCLVFDRYFWSGKHELPWMNANATFLVDASSHGIPERQRQIVSFVYSLPVSTKARVEAYLFEYYQQRVYGSLNGGHAITPEIHKANEIWSLVSKPGIDIPPEKKISASRYFVLNLECLWDPEHGLAILFDSNASPVDVGGQGCFF